MKNPNYTILVCNSYRITGSSQGFCSKNGAVSLLEYLTEECSDRGIDAVVTTTACLNLCSQGPIVVIQPNNYWYGGVTADKVDIILDYLEKGEPVKKFLIE
ncbi:MAG: (2Fe-2S) ferredoxin domain-containing protein [Bacteroidales bacterium OttesenSCG-928-I14]|jgi:(2Fe-2S) ferredoxin|nr:(2Fe-2S) ferredoxin domain-containing protein [Bacteroidales bacterium OttesenSCG-928-I14]